MASSQQTLLAIKALAVIAGVLSAAFPAYGEAAASNLSVAVDDAAPLPSDDQQPMVNQDLQPQSVSPEASPSADENVGSTTHVSPALNLPRIRETADGLATDAAVLQTGDLIEANTLVNDPVNDPVSNSDAHVSPARSHSTDSETLALEGNNLAFSGVLEASTLDFQAAPISPHQAELMAQFDGDGGTPMDEFVPPPALRPDAPEDPLERLSEEDLLEENQGPTLQIEPIGNGIIPANGRAVVRLSGQVLDVDGVVLDRDIIVTLTSSAGVFVQTDYDNDLAGFQILARRGEFETLLRSDLDAQTVQIRAAVNGHQVRGLDPAIDPDPYPEVAAYTEVQFVTDLRPSLVSGVVHLRLGQAGTDFWGSFGDFLNPDLLDNGTEFDPDISLFGIGTLGDWQITGAYTSERNLNERCGGDNGILNDLQACDQTYPVYGDSSTSEFLTPSADSLYLRLQRDSILPGAEPDYLMWGDYSTPEFARSSQTFTATTLQLHGFKGNYSFANGLQVTAMYGNNLQQLQRDTIAPDGTSGFYFLSRRAVLRGSENVFIETEEINRPGTVVERTELYRGADYDIDYDRGTLLFRQPIYATEIDPFGETLVRRIVVTYQLDGGEFGGELYAGRLQYAFTPDLNSWVGATFLHADQGDFDSNLYGVDLQLPIGSIGTFVGEWARSDSFSGGATTSGNAFRLAFNGNVLPNVFGRAYLQSAAPEFQNDYTSSFRPGQTRWGAEIAARIGPSTLLRGLIDQETNVGSSPAVLTSAGALLSPGQQAIQGSSVDNTLTTGQIGIQQRFGATTLGVDWIFRGRDDRITNLNTDSNQVVSRLNLPITGDLSFLAQSELNLGTGDSLYPDRQTVGLEWAVQPGMTLRLAQQFTGGANPGSVTRLDSLIDYALDDNTTLTNRYSLLGGFNGITGQGAIGLNHRMVLAPGLRANFGLERIFGDAFNLTGGGEQFAQPFAVGQNASALGLQSSTAYSIGLEYTDNPDFQASARFEHRDSDSGDNTVFTAAAGGRITRSLTTLFRYEQANFANQTITGNLGNSINLRLGLAYRDPSSDIFNGLLSYEYRNNPSTTPDSILIGSSNDAVDHTLALEGILSPSWQWELYGKYALRYSNVNLADDFGFSNSIHFAQMRATYRFAYRWDVTAGARWIGQPTVGYSETGFALEAGYYLTPDLRLGVGYSFGGANEGSFVGDNAYRSGSGVYLGVTFKVNELLNGFGLQMVSPQQQQDSYVEPDQPANAAPNDIETGGEV
ncbi:MAG: TonB-dependent receptor [Cyanobacteria bacterium P01_A01_bin.123]